MSTWSIGARARSSEVRMQTVIFKSSRSALSLGFCFLFFLLGFSRRTRKGMGMRGTLANTGGDIALLLALCFLDFQSFRISRVGFLQKCVLLLYIFITFMESGKKTLCV